MSHRAFFHKSCIDPYEEKAKDIYSLFLPGGEVYQYQYFGYYSIRRKSKRGE